MKEKKVKEEWVDEAANQIGYNYDGCHCIFTVRENVGNENVFKIRINIFLNIFFVFFKNENKKMIKPSVT